MIDVGIGGFYYCLFVTFYSFEHEQHLNRIMNRKLFCMCSNQLGYKINKNIFYPHTIFLDGDSMGFPICFIK